MCSPHCVPRCAPNEIDYGKIKCWNKFMYSCIHENDLIDMETLWNINVPLVSPLLTVKIFHTFSLVFHSWIWGSVASCVYQQRSKFRQVKIAKHASKGTNYTILTKWLKVQHEKKPVSNLKSMESVVFEQISIRFVEIMFNFFIGKNRSENHLSVHQW